MSHLSNKERLNLKEMIKSYDASDNTKQIQKLKHSRLIRDDVETMLNLQKKYQRMKTTDYKKYEQILISHCNFLWSNYTNIFNRLKKEELDIKILYTFIDKLKAIENGEINQHEASVDIGKILKKLYIDSALRREKNFETQDGKKTVKERKPARRIGWNAYKAKHLI